MFKRNKEGEATLLVKSGFVSYGQCLSKVDPANDPFKAEKRAEG